MFYEASKQNSSVFSPGVSNITYKDCLLLIVVWKLAKPITLVIQVDQICRSELEEAV